MPLKNWIILQFAKSQQKAIQKMASNAIADQEKWFNYLIQKARQTSFGQDHSFHTINSKQAFQKNVPIRNYEDLKDYIEAIIQGDSNVLWPGKPKYFGKTSGTTSGVKYIPISKESIKFHIKTARNAIMNYVAMTGKNVFTKKMIFLGVPFHLNNLGSARSPMPHTIPTKFGVHRTIGSRKEVENAFFKRLLWNSNSC